MASEHESALPGGFSHPGLVVRVGDAVHRPPNPFREAVNPLLEHISRQGLLELPRPIGLDEAGREVFSFVDGEVPFPPYPPWAVTDEVLEGVGALVRRYHDAARSFEIDPATRWATDLADPRGGSIVCHNDVCLENVVFREGRPVGLIDFDLAAPGRPVYDIAMALRLCGPVRHPASRQASFGDVDPIDRIAVFIRGYGPGSELADALAGALVDACRVAARFVEARARSGMTWFAEAWANDGAKRYAADEAWVRAHRDEIRAAARG